MPKKPGRINPIASRLKATVQVFKEWRARRKETAASRKDIKIRLKRIKKDISILQGGIGDQEHHLAHTGSVIVAEAKATIKRLKEQEGFLEERLKRLRQKKIKI